MLFVELYTPENLQLTLIITKSFLLRDLNHLLLFSEIKKREQHKVSVNEERCSSCGYYVVGERDQII